MIDVTKHYFASLSWTDLIPVAELLVIFVGVLYAIQQVRVSRKNRSFRQNHALLSSFHNPEYAKSLVLLSQLTPEDSIKTMDKMSIEDRASIFYLLNMFEGIGAMVYYEQLKIEMVEEYFCGILLTSWERMKPWIDRERTLVTEFHFEWFEWLNNQIIENQKKERRLPAHTREARAT